MILYVSYVNKFDVDGLNVLRNSQFPIQLFFVVELFLAIYKEVPADKPIMSRSKENAIEMSNVEIDVVPNPNR